ncbi:MAG: hypothetical protein QM762_18010 [Chryseolinea sp.]
MQTFNKRLLIILFLVGLASDLFGQVKLLTGKVIGAEFRTRKDKTPYEFWDLHGAKIFWKDSLITTTDEKGNFRIELTQEIDSIRVAWIGMYPDKIRIAENCEYIEVILLPDVIYDFVTVGKEERLRKKDRAILPELYKTAYEKGIFKQEEPCR